MRVNIIIVLFQLLYLNVSAQQDQTFRINSVKADSSPLYKSVYQYPQFINGNIFFKNKNVASALLNYNRLSGQLLFINGKGDTLEPVNPEDIQMVAVLQDTFHYFEKSWLELISHHKDGINLLKNETIKYNGNEKKSAYGGYSNAAAASSIDKVANEKNMQQIDVDENMLYVSATRFYLGGHNGNFFPAGRRNFKKLFSQNEKKLNKYLSENQVNYNHENDLLRLIDYLQN